MNETEWYAEVKRIYNFHIKMVKEHGKHKNKGRAGKSGWSENDTCKALVLSKGKVSEAIRLYKFSLKDGQHDFKNLPERRAAMALMKYMD